MSKSSQIFIIALFLLSLSCLSTAQKGELYSLNFKNNDLEVFIEFTAKATGKQILYDPSVRGRKIFLISTKPVTKKQIFAVFKSVMEYNGFILETVGKGNATLIKVKRNILGPWTPTVTVSTKEELEKYSSEDQFITMVIKLKYISAREVQTTLRALRIVNPQGGNLGGIESSNTIFVTDYAPNVYRVFQAISIMDQPPSIETLNLPIKVDGQTIPITVLQSAEIFATFNVYQNIAVTVTNDSGQVITHLDSMGSDIKLWLNPHISKKSSKLHFTLQVLNNEKNKDKSMLTILIFSLQKNQKKSYNLWSFSLKRFLSTGKKIRFTLDFNIKGR